MNTTTDGLIHSRRRLLQIALVGAVSGLAGCLDGEDDNATDDEPEETNSDSSEPDDESVNGQSLSDVLQWESSYAMELVVPLGNGTVVFHENDSYTSWSVNDVDMEVYRIGTDEYIVVDGECFIPAGSSDDELFEPERLLEESGDITAAEIVSIDGQEAYLFNVDDGSLYLSTDTGYPIRFESDDGATVQFHSWGETDPISPPDMECIEQ